MDCGNITNQVINMYKDCVGKHLIVGETRERVCRSICSLRESSSCTHTHSHMIKQ